MTKFENGELFVYTNGDRWELGMVKCPNNTGDGYFCWYSRGDTAANTPTEHMHKLANAGFSHIERTATHMIVNHGVTGHSACTGCGKAIDPWDSFCKHCGARLEGGWK